MNSTHWFEIEIDNDVFINDWAVFDTMIVAASDKDFNLVVIM